MVAKGIEDVATRDLLTGLGCDAGQGYLFAKPLPWVEMEGFLRAAATGDEDGEVISIHGRR